MIKNYTFICVYIRLQNLIREFYSPGLCAEYRIHFSTRSAQRYPKIVNKINMRGINSIKMLILRLNCLDLSRLISALNMKSDMLIISLYLHMIKY